MTEEVSYMQFCHREEPGQQKKNCILRRVILGRILEISKEMNGNPKHHGESERQPREKNKLQL